MKIIFYILSYLVIVVTILPFIPSSVWWIRVMEFPRFQFVLFGIAAVIIFVIYRQFNLPTIITGVLLCTAIIYQSIHIYPYTFLAKKQVMDSDKWQEGKTISLIITNVLMENKNSEKLIQIIELENPDLVIAQETNQWWVNQLKRLENKYQYRMYKPLDNTYGMAFFSKLKLIEPEFRYLIEANIPSIHSFIELSPGNIIEVHFLHPRPPIPNQSEDTKERDAELVLVGKEVKRSNYPVLVAGDLNDVAWSETSELFQEVSGLLDPRVGRGFYNTFHADYFFLRWPLDYIFHSNHFKLINIKRLSHFGSDHFPMYVRLSYQPEAVHQQEKPTADQEDKKKARKIIEDGINDND